MDILDEVSGKYGTMSAVQKRIADYVFTYPDEVCFLSLKDFSETLGVTEVTILRFIKKIGFSGYVDFKKCLKDHLRVRLSNGDFKEHGAFPGNGSEGGGMNKNDLFQTFANNEYQVLKSTYSQVSLEQVLEASSILKQARVVYVVGSELTTPISQYMMRRLSTLGLHVHDLGAMTKALYGNFISHIGPEDAVVMFSIPGYMKHLVNTAKYLAKRQVPQILITDKMSAPQAAHATVVLTCDNHDLFFFNNVLGMFSLSSMLVHFVAVYDPEDTNRLRLQLSEARNALAAVVTNKG